MNRRELMTGAAGGAVFVAGTDVAAGRAEPPSLRRTTGLAPLLQPYLAKFGLPALAAAVIVKGRVAAAGVAGVRRSGTRIPVALDDRFHIGSEGDDGAACRDAGRGRQARLDLDGRRELPGAERHDGRRRQAGHARAIAVAHERHSERQRDPALAIKFTIRRTRPSGSPGDADIFGSQHYGPLLGIEVPDE